MSINPGWEHAGDQRTGSSTAWPAGGGPDPWRSLDPPEPPPLRDPPDVAIEETAEPAEPDRYYWWAFIPKFIILPVIYIMMRIRIFQILLFIVPLMIVPVALVTLDMPAALVGVSLGFFGIFVRDLDRWLPTMGKIRPPGVAQHERLLRLRQRDATWMFIWRHRSEIEFREWLGILLTLPDLLPRQVFAAIAGACLATEAAGYALDLWDRSSDERWVLVGLAVALVRYLIAWFLDSRASQAAYTSETG
jgi:hypothetical protein